LVAPAGGDELQGVKRGIMELADIIVVNKCDGALELQGTATLSDYSSALRLIRPVSPNWTPVAMAASAVTGRGVPELWDIIRHRHAALEASGELHERRASQRQAWLWEELRDELFDRFRADTGIRRQVAALEKAVANGKRSIASAVNELLGERP
jgi:LAO/AO transport system kinase